MRQIASSGGTVSSSAEESKEVNQTAWAVTVIEPSTLMVTIGAFPIQTEKWNPKWHKVVSGQQKSGRMDRAVPGRTGPNGATLSRMGPKRDRFSVALYATEERSPELWSNRTW